MATLRADGSPASSVVFYAMDGDELIFSTTRDRLKVRTLERDPRIAVTVLDEGEPFRFVSIEGTARIQGENLAPGHVAVNRAMRRQPEWAPPEGFAEGLRAAGRVVIRVTPLRVSGVVRRG